MPVIKRIVCLANSRKMAGRCIAGREVFDAGPGRWIRPVSARQTEEVSEREREYQDGSDPRVLDIIDVPLVGPRPHTCQTENWLLDPDYCWAKVRQIGWAELRRYVEDPPTLWVNDRSTYNGVNDELLQADADALSDSLVLIRVPTLDLRVFAPRADFGDSKRRVQAHFRHRNIQYALWVTDPVIEREYKARSDGSYKLGECCMCISLGEPMRKQYSGEWCRYKLVAAVIRRTGVST